MRAVFARQIFKSTLPPRARHLQNTHTLLQQKDAYLGSNIGLLEPLSTQTTHMDTFVEAVEQESRGTRRSRRRDSPAASKTPAEQAKNSPKDDPNLDAESSDDKDDQSTASAYSYAVGWNLPKKVSLKGHVKLGANSVKELKSARLCQ